MDSQTYNSNHTDNKQRTIAQTGRKVVEALSNQLGKYIDVFKYSTRLFQQTRFLLIAEVAHFWYRVIASVYRKLPFALRVFQVELLELGLVFSVEVLCYGQDCNYRSCKGQSIQKQRPTHFCISFNNTGVHCMSQYFFSFHQRVAIFLYAAFQVVVCVHLGFVN